MVPSSDFIEWLWPTVHWLFEEVLYLEGFLGRESIVTPRWEDFPVDEALEGHALALDYLAFVEEHAGTSEHDWELELVPREAASAAKILEGMPHAMTGAVEGGVELDLGPDDPLPIEYEPGLEGDPEMLVAILSRGVAHWQCALQADLPDGGENFDYVVDLVWVLSGFGVFASNCAFRTHATERGAMIGWGTQRFGALGQLELAYCLGLYAELLALDDRDVLEHLAPNPRAWFIDARKDLRRNSGERIARLRVVPAGPGPYRR